MLWICHIQPILRWGRFLLYPYSEEFFHKWMLNFVKSFLCIHSMDYMVFIFQFVNMVHHIDWFACIEESLHHWDKPHLITVWDPSNVLLDYVCKNFVEDLHLYLLVILVCNFVFLCNLYLVLVSGWWPRRMSLEVFLHLQFFERILEG